MNTTTQNLADLAGRILLAIIFLVAGIQKIGGYAGTQAYMESMGVPGMLLPLVIALEIAGAIAILVGWRTRLAALLLAGFSVLAAAVFHRALGDNMQAVMFMKNLAIAGGFLLLAARGPGEWSIDAGGEPLPNPEARRA
jgi:putative oxidoreductase